MLILDESIEPVLSPVYSIRQVLISSSHFLWATETKALLVLFIKRDTDGRAGITDPLVTTFERQHDSSAGVV